MSHKIIGVTFERWKCWKPGQRNTFWTETFTGRERRADLGVTRHHYHHIIEGLSAREIIWNQIFKKNVFILVPAWREAKVWSELIKNQLGSIFLEKNFWAFFAQSAHQQAAENSSIRHRNPKENSIIHSSFSIYVWIILHLTSNSSILS